jgi:hypothetical protein
MYWRNIVRIYSDCHLTNERDKLVAIGGIAKQFAQSYDWGRYVAGLWSNNLVPQLMWEPADPVKSKRPSQYRAPTWSWASVDGEISFSRCFGTDPPDVMLISQFGKVLIEYPSNSPMEKLWMRNSK